MKVVLIQDVPKLGKKGEVINSSDGYARTFLIPRVLAREATPEVLKQLEKEKEEEKKRLEALKRESENLLSELHKHVFKIKAKAGDGGKLFGSLTSANISDVISKTLSKEFDKKWIVLDNPIKALGTYDVTVKLPGGVSGKIKVEVLREE